MIVALISQAATYDLAGDHSILPSWEVNITCVDWLNRCNDPNKKGVMAYTTNPETRGDEKGIFMDTITFCPTGAFLDPTSNIESCATRIAKFEHSALYTESGHLYNYRCWGKYCKESFEEGKSLVLTLLGYVVLHELFHLNSLSRVSNRGHVYDRWVVFYHVDNPRVKKKMLAYGPEHTKILGTYPGITAGIYAATNVGNTVSPSHAYVSTLSQHLVYQGDYLPNPPFNP